MRLQVRSLGWSWVKGISDPRSLSDPEPYTDVHRGRAGGSKTFGAQATPNCKSKVTIYVDICSSLLSLSVHSAVWRTQREKIEISVISPEGSCSGREREYNVTFSVVPVLWSG